MQHRSSSRWARPGGAVRGGCVSPTQRTKAPDPRTGRCRPERGADTDRSAKAPRAVLRAPARPDRAPHGRGMECRDDACFPTATARLRRSNAGPTRPPDVGRMDETSSFVSPDFAPPRSSGGDVSSKVAQRSLASAQTSQCERPQATAGGSNRPVSSRPGLHGVSALQTCRTCLCTGSAVHLR